ncbi:transcription factor Pcc1 [Suhomyces tanzawaensis NRRL Y-17324]|uniref:Transcription factor Pcc1 n=1 Tax=Suhomyces tanzawaensis NRRL Y-17324 TaxID=984487 RepID=A0A1E4SCJ8_9ASCO|nr:transcription factor Pcc1 [Suhomyces tanzawaensis NRRL Y-17324]ODV77186.1 transcription factor Pcc1 [Suhomyces tanzawaensis NRRL Y-17324]
MATSLPYTLNLSIPFESARQAEIACKTLSPDPILKVNELNVKYSHDSNTLTCAFSGVSDRVIRVAVSNVIDNIKTIIECMDEFDGKEDELFQ